MCMTPNYSIVAVVVVVVDRQPVDKEVIGKTAH